MTVGLVNLAVPTVALAVFRVIAESADAAIHATIHRAQATVATVAEPIALDLDRALLMAVAQEALYAWEVSAAAALHATTHRARATVAIIVPKHVAVGAVGAVGGGAAVLAPTYATECVGTETEYGQ